MKKRTLVSLTEKIKTIAEIKREVKRKKDISSKFGIPASTLSAILKN